MDAIRIIIGDHHTLFREGLKHLLARERDILVTAEASRAEEVEPAVARGQGEVLLLDTDLPGREALQILLELKQDHPETRPIIVTARQDGDTILNTAKTGARGYVLKTDAPATLFQAVRHVYGGGIWIDKGLPGAADFTAIAAQTQVEQPLEETDRVQSLTRRELEILKLLAQGFSNHEIANKAFTSERTVRAHITSIFAKLKVDNRVKAALAILRRGDPLPASPASPAPRPRAAPRRSR
jgi:DNA-binding NarL/FixJ family response regulator